MSERQPDAIVIRDWFPTGEHRDRLLALLRENYWLHLADQIEAQTKTPRIPEPGLWGVVEATFKNGRARHGWAVRRLTDGGRDWQDGAGDYHRWDELIDPVLVREGVES